MAAKPLQLRRRLPEHHGAGKLVLEAARTVFSSATVTFFGGRPGLYEKRVRPCFYGPAKPDRIASAPTCPRNSPLPLRTGGPHIESRSARDVGFALAGFSTLGEQPG